MNDKTYFEEKKKDLLIGLASGFFLWVCTLTGEGAADIAKANFNINANYLGLIKIGVTIIVFLMLFIYIEKQKYKK